METRIERRACITCGQEFDDEFTVFVMFGRERPLPHQDCPTCRAAKLEEERHQAEDARITKARDIHAGFRSRAGMPRSLGGKTFENWVGRSAASLSVRKFAKGFPIGDAFEYPSLFLYSKANGLGKSHLVAACANTIFDRWLAAAIAGEIEVADNVRCPVLYQTGPDLILRVRSTYNIRPEDALWRETEAELYETLKTIPLLILDDLGKEAEARASEHTQRVYFQIIDGRYLNRLPLIICSNMDQDEVEAFLGPKVGPAVKDRLIEMTHDRVIELLGKSYRKRMWAKEEQDETR